MNAITFYRREADGEAALEYNFYDHQFAPTNLVVRKILMAMMGAVRHRLTHLEAEYNDGMLAEKLGRRAADVLRLLGATRDNVRENKSGEVTVSRTFRAELTPERYDYFYHLRDVSELPHYRLLEGETDRVVFFFGQYLLLRLPVKEEPRFADQLHTLQVPFRIVPVERP